MNQLLSLAPKNFLLAAFLCSAMPVQTAPAISTNTVDAVISAAVVGTVIYGGHWLYALYLYKRANKRYELPLAVIAAYDNHLNEEKSLYQELLPLINIDNAAWSCPSSRYYNYPLVEFVVDLNETISSLSDASWLTMPTQLSTDMHLLKQQLQRVKYYCVRHPGYIEQRRRADELAVHAARHVVVH